MGEMGGYLCDDLVVVPSACGAPCGAPTHVHTLSSPSSPALTSPLPHSVTTNDWTAIW